MSKHCRTALSFVPLLWGTILLYLTHQVAAQNGQTSVLEEVFIGRCWDFQLTEQTTRYGKVNCTQLWKSFLTAFAYKPECGISPNDYDDFVKQSKINVPKDKALFWARSYPFDKEFSNRGKRFTVVTDVLSGFMLDDLSWCGQKQPPGYRHGNCSTCNTSAVIAFWRSLSRVFAAKAEGRIQVLLNGSTEEAYVETSVLAQFEVPAWTTNKIKEIRIWVVHSLNGVQMETCEKGSPTKLYRMLTTRGFPTVCMNDPRATRYLQCADDPQNKLCPETNVSLLRNRRKAMLAGIIVMSVLFLVVLVGCLVMVLRRRC